MANEQTVIEQEDGSTVILIHPDYAQDIADELIGDGSQKGELNPNIVGVISKI